MSAVLLVPVRNYSSPPRQRSRSLGPTRGIFGAVWLQGLSIERAVDVHTLNVMLCVLDGLLVPIVLCSVHNGLPFALARRHTLVSSLTPSTK